MKKLFSLFLLCSTFSLTSCGASNKNNKITNSGTSNTNKTTDNAKLLLSK